MPIVVGAALLLVAGVAQVAHLVAIRSVRSHAPLCRVITADRSVALTFDDGPDPDQTGEVLDLLASVGGHATFFVIGEHARAFPALIDEIVDAGHELGGHTWSHPHLDDLDAGGALEEIERGSADLPVDARALFRPPFGEIGADTLEDLRADGVTVILWSVPLDHVVAGSASPEAAARTLVEELAPGDIVLAHDADDGPISRDRAIEMLGFLVPMLDDAGFELVTVSELLRRGRPVRAAPRPWFWQSGFGCPGD